MGNFSEFLKIWSLRSNSVTRQVTFNRIKIGGKCQNWKIQMRHFKWFSNNVNFLLELLTAARCESNYFSLLSDRWIGSVMTRSHRRNHPSPMGPSQKHVFPQKFYKSRKWKPPTKFPLLSNSWEFFSSVTSLIGSNISTKGTKVG